MSKRKYNQTDYTSPLNIRGWRNPGSLSSFDFTCQKSKHLCNRTRESVFVQPHQSPSEPHPLGTGVGQFAPKNIPRNTVTQNPLEKQKNSQNCFQGTQIQSGLNLFKSLKSSAFFYNAALKAAHASAKHPSQNSLPLSFWRIFTLLK